MGIRNRERRKAKQRAREQRRRDRPTREERFGFGGSALPEAIHGAILSAAFAFVRGDTDGAAEHVDWLVEMSSDEGTGLREIIDGALFTNLESAIGAGWPMGWQPQDLARLVDRRFGARHVRLAADLMRSELRRYAPATVDERWDAQLQTLDAEVWWGSNNEYFSRWGERERLDRTATITHALQVLSAVGFLPELPQLCPPPGAARRGSLRATDRTADQRMLARVRALLAKAESTEFAEEADAYTAKAQELMARHSIDYALLAATQGGRDEPVGIRVGVDRPYEAAKSTLLAQVATANRCNAVWSVQFGFSTVLGYPADLESVELLYTSLLVQATAAMMREGSHKDMHGRSRTRSFRESFLNAYAVRIGQRLRGATEDASKAVLRERGEERLLPVLAARDDAVKEATEAMFPDIVNRQVTVSNAAGWASGTAAADLASLHTSGAVAGAPQR